MEKKTKNCKINHPVALRISRKSPQNEIQKENSKHDDEQRKNFKMYLLSHADYVSLNLSLFLLHPLVRL